MKFMTQYNWEYKIKGHTIFKEPLEIEVEVKDKNWWITKIGLSVKNVCGSGYAKIWLDEDEDLYHIMKHDIEEDDKFNRSIINETI